MGPDRSAAIAAHWSVANWSSWSLRSLIFLIPAFLDLLNPCIHGSSWSLRSWIFLIPAFMDVPDHCVHGSSWSLHSWVFLIPAFMGLLDPCVHGSSWSLHSWIFLIPAFCICSTSMCCKCSIWHQVNEFLRGPRLGKLQWVVTRPRSSLPICPDRVTWQKCRPMIGQEKLA